MVNTKGGLWMSLLIAVFMVSALGCASSGVYKAIGPDDLPSLAGKWVGTVTLPSGRSTPGTMDLSPNGDYVARAGAFSATGKASVKDGGLQLVSTSTTGGLATGQRTSAAALAERPNGAQVLTGTGHSDAGPFSFEVVRQK